MKLLKPLLCFLLIFWTLPGHAQDEAPYTSLNEITIKVIGNNIPYTYFSNQLLFRFDEQAAKLELRVPIASFTPANTGSPQVLFQELFLARQFPEMVLLFDAPIELLQTQDLKPQDRRMKAVLLAQGIARDINADVHLLPLPGQFTFSTSFNFSVFGPNVILSRDYAGMVQGPVEVVIEKARWIYRPQDGR